MRTLTYVAGLMAVGTVCALPFRRTPDPIDPQQPQSIATGPLGHQFEEEAMRGVQQWPNRPGFDPALAWQPRPMLIDDEPRGYELPEMPASFPSGQVDIPTPAPIRDRFSAAQSLPDPTNTDAYRRDSVGGAKGFVLPPMETIEDRFVYTPAPRSNDSNVDASVPPSMMAGSNPRYSAFKPASAPAPSVSPIQDNSPRQPTYIREPE